MNFKTFAISSNKVTRKLVNSKFNQDESKDVADEAEPITGINKTGIEGTFKKRQKKELVIPLIVNNVWREETTMTDPIYKATRKEIQRMRKEIIPASTGEISDELERQAVREILESANLKFDTTTKEIPEIPLLLKNRIPTGYEEDDNMDVSLRPEQSTLDDYEHVPIKEYGMAMLRGMGWSKKEGIGLRNKGHVEIKEPQLRPKGLGLGAERPQSNKDIVSQSAASNAKDGKVTQYVKLGGYALITKGSDKGLYGKIESFDEDNNRIHLKLSISARMVAVSKFNVTIVSDSEYKQKSKVLNNDKYEKYKLKSDERLERHGREGEDREDHGGSSESDSRRNERRKESRSTRRDSPESKSKKRKHHEEKSHRSERKKDKRRRDSPGSKKSRRHRDEKSYRRSP